MGPTWAFVYVKKAERARMSDNFILGGQGRGEIGRGEEGGGGRNGDAAMRYVCE